MAQRILIEQAENGYAVRYGHQQNLAEAPLRLIATWGELVDFLDHQLNDVGTRTFGERDSFPLIEALQQPASHTALERRKRNAEAPTIKLPDPTQPQPNY